MPFGLGSMCYPDVQSYAAAWVAQNSQVTTITGPHPYGDPGTFTFACRWVADTTNEYGTAVMFSLQCENSQIGVTYFPSSFWDYGNSCATGDSEVITASVEVFAAGLVALAVIWAGKQVYRVLTNGRNDGG